jgi:hypothetical protein
VEVLGQLVRHAFNGVLVDLHQAELLLSLCQHLSVVASTLVQPVTHQQRVSPIVDHSIAESAQLDKSDHGEERVCVCLPACTSSALKLVAVGNLSESRLHRC